MSKRNTDAGLAKSVDKNAAAFRICAKIFEFWRLTELESSRMLRLSYEEWQSAKCARSLPAKALDDLSRILWIARLCTDLYPLDKELSVAWLRKNIFEEPFWGMSPLYFMLSKSEEPLARTHRFLALKFDTWGALRDERNELVYLNDELRISDEPIDTLMCMALRVARSWQLSAQEERGLLGTEFSSNSDCRGLRPDTLVKARMIVLIDLVLWHIFHDGNKVAAWVRANNMHPLFEEKSPLQLLCSGDVGVMKVVYAYLRNISP